MGVNAWPFSVSTSAKNSRRISLKSVGLTVLRSTVIFLFSHHLSISNSVALLVFLLELFAQFHPVAICLNPSLDWKKAEKSPNVKRSLQSYKVSKCKFAPTLVLKWYPQDFIGRAKLFDISAASQYQDGKCIFSPGICRLARKKARFTDGGLSFGRAC